MDEKLGKIQEIFRGVLDDDSLEITPSYSTSGNPGWDSVAMVQILLAVESEFGVKFTTDEVARIKTVADLLKKVK